jgi:hypothetical protein
MSKIGVGVGDEFPVDDSANANPNTPSTPQDDRAEFESWKQRRDAWRAQQQARREQRDAWHAQRDAMKQEWRKRRHEWRAQAHQWRDEMRGEFETRGDDGYRYGPRWHGGWHRHGGAKLLGLVAILALVIFAVSHIGTILMSLAAVAVLVIAWHHFGPGGHRFDHYRYAGPTAPPSTSAPSAPPPAPQAPADTTKES